MSFELLGYTDLGYDSDTDIDDIKYTDLTPVNKTMIQKIQAATGRCPRSDKIKEIYFSILEAIEDGREQYTFSFNTSINEQKVMIELKRLFPGSVFQRKPFDIINRRTYCIYIR